MSKREEADALLFDLWTELPEGWDEDSSGCRWGCSPYSTGELGRHGRHQKDCIFIRIKHYIEGQHG